MKRREIVGKVFTQVFVMAILMTPLQYEAKAEVNNIGNYNLNNISANNYIAVKKNRKVKYDVTKECFHNLTAVKKGGKWGFIDDEGKLVTPVKYDSIKVNKSIDAFTDPYVAVKLKGKWGFVNDEGKTVIKPKYEKAGNIVHGIAKVKHKGKWGFINAYDGKNTTPFKYDKIENYYADDATVLVKGKKGVVFGGKEVIPPKYDETDFIAGAFYYRVKLNNKWGFVDSDNGKEIIHPKYDEADNLRDNRAVVKQNGKWGTIDKDDKLIIPFNYDYIGEFAYNVFHMKQGEKLGLIDVDGDIVVPAEYDEIYIDIKHNEKNETATLFVTTVSDNRENILKFGTKIKIYEYSGYDYGKWSPIK